MESQLKLENPEIKNMITDQESNQDFDATDTLVTEPRTKPGLGADPSKPKSRKKKEIRKEKALAKLKASGMTDEEIGQVSHQRLL